MGDEIKVNKELEEKIKELVEENKVAEAVKLVHEINKCGLRVAKDFVDKLTGKH